MRAAIFIDGGYLLKQLQDAKVNPDYSRLAEFLLRPLRRNTQLDLMRCYFYYCPPWMSEKPTEAELRRMAAHERFMAEMQEGCDRWQVRLGKLERRREGDKEVFAQKRVDVQLSVDLVQHTAAGHIQHAVLVAGDSDFIPAIVAAKESGTTLTLWCDRDRSVHRDLLKLADEVHYIRWKDFPSRPWPETRADVQRPDQRPEARTDLPQDGRLEARPEPRPVERFRETQMVLAPDAPAELRSQVQDPRPEARPEARPESPQATTADGEVPKKKRGRRRGSGKVHAAKPVVGEGVNEASSAPASADHAPPGVTPAQPQTLAPTVAAKPRHRAPSRSQGQKAPPVPAAAPVEVVEEAGDDIGNRAEDQASAGAKTGRRRRGGRGRRRKGPAVGSPSGEP